MSDDLNTRARLRLRDEKAKLGFSEQDIAGMIRWTQSRVAQKLSGRTDITLNELEALGFALSISPTEIVRDRGLEFVAEMTPTELRALEHLRKMSPVERDAFFHLIGAKAKATDAPDRYARPPKKSHGRQKIS